MSTNETDDSASSAPPERGRGEAVELLLLSIRSGLAEGRALAALVLGAGAGAAGHTALALAAAWLAAGLGREGGASVPNLGTISYLGLAAALVKATGQAVAAGAQARIVGIAGARAARATFDSAAAAPSGALLGAQATVRLRAIEGAVDRGALGGARALLAVLPLLASMIAVSGAWAFGAAVALAPFTLAGSYLRRRWARRAAQARESAEELQAGVDDLFLHLDLYRTHGAAARVGAEVEQAARRGAESLARAERQRVALSGANEVVGALALVCVLALTARLGSPLPSDHALALVALVFMAYRPLRDLGDARAALDRGALALGALERAVPGTVARLGAPVAPPAAAGEPTAPALLERLVATELGARTHGPRTSLRVEPGEIVAVSGATGSGKTTLLRALLGLDPTVGGLTYGDRSLADAGVGPAVRPFAWVPQEAPLGAGTVLDNVRLLGASDAAARAALASLGAGALSDDPRPIGPGGRRPSGGERRLIALARALASGQPVLLVDEPTEGLDPAAEALVLQALSQLRGARSVLLVSHRERVVAIADRAIRVGERSDPTRVGVPVPDAGGRDDQN
ncbi:MAG: ATP-binding cassette domain-containing protein [Polyangiaceae bacterium]|nr:ATP-binding cassette domain-containing protein [Polyangiaceae bacterium]